MKLVHPDLHMQIEFVENQVIVWVIESPKLLRNYIKEFILNPFEIQVNEKRCWNKVCTELKEIAFSENYYMQTQQLFATINQYLLSLEMDSEMEFSWEGEIDFMQLLKATGIKIEESNDSLVEHLGQYIKVMARLLQKKVIVFVNLSTFLEKKEIEQLLQQAFYLKVYIILLESREICLEIPKKCYIIDKDSCEIY